MEFNQKKLGIVMAAAIVIGASTLGVLFYSSHKADAREAAEKQVLMENIKKQQDLQEAAKQAKADAPVVSEEYPAKITPETVQAPKESTPTPELTKQTDQTAATTKDTPPIAIPQQSPEPPKVAPKEVMPPSAQQEPVQAITALSEADIQRLQSYAQYSTIGGKTTEAYISFEKMYSTERSGCDWLLQKFSPITLSDYYRMKAEWLTDPRLVYKSAINQYCVRGVLTLTAYEDGNKFGLTPNLKYQREVEYRLRNSVTQGQVTLKLESTHFLSELKAVK